MTEVEAMKSLLFLLVTFSLQVVFAAQPFSGFFSKRGEGYYFTPKSSQFYYEIIALNRDVEENLARLDNGDLVSGFGTLDTFNKKITVQSIDYVGLQKILGPWIGREGTILFKDFSTMRFTPRFRDFKIDARLYQKEFRYSISPTETDEWALFLSDSTNTTFATVEFSEKKIILKIFESESGKIVRTLKLGRP